ncbi:MAG UNVERIFIED_CONTAM: FHA domain-containing protein [Planctomycetaceae bacterium]|jgi:hypothetical protein
MRRFLLLPVELTSACSVGRKAIQFREFHRFLIFLQINYPKGRLSQTEPGDRVSLPESSGCWHNSSRGNGGPAITLTSSITVVGRSSRLCELVIDHSSISKQHCMLVKTDGLVYVRDLGSTNGTRVNGQRVIRGALLPGTCSRLPASLTVFTWEQTILHAQSGQRHSMDAHSPRR